MSKITDELDELLSEYGETQSTERLHSICSFVLKTILWKIIYESKDYFNSEFCQRIQAEDVTNSIYLKVYKWVLEGNYKNSKHLLNKAKFQIRIVRFNEVMQWEQSIFDDYGEVFCADQLSKEYQSFSSKYPEKLLDKASNYLLGNDSEVLRLFSCGYSFKEIAQRSGVSINRTKEVIQIARKDFKLIYMWQPRQQNLSDMSTQIIPLRQNGMSIKQIAAKLNVSYKKVRNTILKAELIMQKPAEERSH